jgi:CBS domain-containing protein
LKVRDLPPGRLVSVDPSTKLAAVAREMRVHDSDSVAGVRHLPVVDEPGKLSGLLSARNLVAVLDRARP